MSAIVPPYVVFSSSCAMVGNHPAIPSLLQRFHVCLYVAIAYATWILILSGCAALPTRKLVDESVVLARNRCQQGMIAMHAQRWDDAESYFRQAIRSCPSNRQAHEKLAEVLWRRGAADQAISHLMSAVELSGNDPTLLVRLGQMVLAEGNLDAAHHYARQALEIDPRHARGWALLGDIEQRAGHQQAARAHYHRSLTYARDAKPVLRALAESYMSTGQHRRALAAIQRLEDEFDPGKEPQWLLLSHGMTLRALGRDYDAVERLASAHRRGAPNAAVMIQLAEAWLSIGKYASAMQIAHDAEILGGRTPRLGDLQNRIHMAAESRGNTLRR